jgi:hypothetical protein
LHLQQRYILVSGSSAARVCLRTKYASLLPHSVHSILVFGSVADDSEIMVVSLPFASVVKCCVFSAVFVAPHLLHLYWPSLGNIIDPHEQNID